LFSLPFTRVRDDRARMCTLLYSRKSARFGFAVPRGLVAPQHPPVRLPRLGQLTPPHSPGGIDERDPWGGSFRGRDSGADQGRIREVLSIHPGPLGQGCSPRPSGRKRDVPLTPK